MGGWVIGVGSKDGEGRGRPGGGRTRPPEKAWMFAVCG